MMLDASDHDLLRQLATQLEERSRVANRRFDRIEAQLETLLKANGHSRLMVNGGWVTAGGSIPITIAAILKAMGVW